MDYSQEYFTIESLEDNNTITLTIPASVTSSQLTSVSYSTDGSTWTQVNIDSTAQTITVNLNNGQKAYFKGVGLTYSSSGDTSNSSMFSGTKRHNIYGNIFSLLYGDNFSNIKDLPNSTRTYGHMFYGDTNLVDASNLILCFADSTLRSNCYSSMFRDCTSLVQAPSLPAATLATNCYYQMFRGCTSLVIAPELPATTLQNSCYYFMFYQCTSLNKASILPATILLDSCYRGMFYKCNKINEITCLATDISASNCLTSWLDQVSSSGTFYKNPNMSSFPSSASGIPSGWTTEAANTFTFNGHYPDNITLNGTPLNYFKVNGTQVWRRYYYTNYFTIESLEASNTITLNIGSSVTTSDVAWIAWSKDKTNWTTTNNVDNQIVTITVSANANEKVYWKGEGTTMALGNINSTQKSIFSSTKKINVYGNIASLLYGDNFLTVSIMPSSSTRTYQGLFYNCTTLISASNLILPFTTITMHGYRDMFRQCTSLVKAPALPATTLAANCYYEMFRGCSLLNNAPELPATNLEHGCYNNMFRDCISLGQADLHATTLANYCYENMFNGCTNLQEVTCLATDISATDCLLNWLSGVSASGTFYKDSSMTSWPSGSSGIPSGWTVQNYVS